MTKIPYTGQMAECCTKAFKELRKTYAIGYSTRDLWFVLGDMYNFRCKWNNESGGYLQFKNDADATMFLLRYS